MTNVISQPKATGRLTYRAAVERIIDHLRETRGEWRIVQLKGSGTRPLRGLRRYVYGTPTCPLTSAFGGAGERMFSDSDTTVSLKLGSRIRDEINCAADGHLPDDMSEAQAIRIRKLRRRMLRAASPSGAAKSGPTR